MASSFVSPWPDPNSCVLSKINFGVPLPELLKWLDVRDTFLGANYKTQDIRAALNLARDCKHPDALWLSSVFEGKDGLTTKEEAKEVFLRHENDARALCFVWWLSSDFERDVSVLGRAAEMGCAFACSTLCDQQLGGTNKKEEAFRLAQRAAALHERAGFFVLGRCFHSGIGCGEDFNLAKENLLIASELGCVDAVELYFWTLNDFDLAGWIWLGRAALRRAPELLLFRFSRQVERFFSGSGNPAVVFLIGCALKGNINMEKKEIFGSNYDFDARIGPANQAVSFYESQIRSARLAIDTWTLISTRLHVIKDLRIYIGKIIWEARLEANYMI